MHTCEIFLYYWIVKYICKCQFSRFAEESNMHSHSACSRCCWCPIVMTLYPSGQTLASEFPLNKASFSRAVFIYRIKNRHAGRYKLDHFQVFISQSDCVSHLLSFRSLPLLLKRATSDNLYGAELSTFYRRKLA